MFSHAEYVTLENYHILKDEMKSFDILMFRGSDIISDTIAEIQKSNSFTHIGLIINSNVLPEFSLKPDRLYILESTYSYEIPGMNNGPPDFLTGERFFGVQIRDLEDICKSYIHNEKTQIAWYALQNSPSIKNFGSTFKQYHKRPFLNYNILPIDYKNISPELMIMAKSIMTASLLQTVLNSSFSCVGLVISLYSELKILTTPINKSIIYPMDLLNELLRYNFIPQN